jgi:hypothetical protein
MKKENARLLVSFYRIVAALSPLARKTTKFGDPAGIDTPTMLRLLANDEVVDAVADAIFKAEIEYEVGMKQFDGARRGMGELGKKRDHAISEAVAKLERMVADA